MTNVDIFITKAMNSVLTNYELAIVLNGLSQIDALPLNFLPESSNETNACLIYPFR